MTNDNKILATYVTYKTLYNDKNTDVYDIISEFVRYIILKEHKKSFSQVTFPGLITKYFDFQIPSLVLKPAIKRIKGVTLSNKQYNVDYSMIDSSTNFDKMQEDALVNNQAIINDLVAYIKEKSTDIITVEEINKISNSFRRYILDESSNGKYDKYISAFIIEKSSDSYYVGKINQIREGHILYSGLSFNGQVSEQGWKGKLTIYLDMEIIFHLAGYNGTTFQQISNEFISLVEEANTKESLITLKYFSETKKEIEDFFGTAETLFKNNSIVRPGETAMSSILSDSKIAIDITNKMNSLFYFLDQRHIYEEKKSDFYSAKYEKANLESSQYVNPNEQSDIRLISHINKLRHDNTFTDYSETPAILISETGSVLELSRIITSEKELQLSKLSGNEHNIVPLALNLYTITNILWYRLNKSLHRKTEPSTVDAVIRAQIVLSKYINESIVKEYNELIEKQKTVNVDKDELTALILGMRRRSSKPEDLIKEGIDDALNLLCENDINKFKEDYELEISAHNKLKTDYKELKAQLAATNENIDILKLQNKCTEFYLDYKYAKDRLSDLQDQNEIDKISLDKQEYILTNSKKSKTRFIIASYILFYVTIVICIIKFTWNIMEPITYILGIPPIIYLFISKYINVKWNIFNFINSYKNSKNYVDAKNKYDASNIKVNVQKNLVAEKLNIYNKCQESLNE